MAAVTVFVDDAVLGRVPYVCAKTGAPAEGLLTIHTRVGGQTNLGVAWILLVLGPLGWLGLVILALTSRGDGETLTVQVPWTEAAQHELDRARRLRRKLWLIAAAVLAATVTVVGLDAGFTGQIAALLLLVATCFGVAALVAGIEVGRAQIDVGIDASRRWVTLGAVHNDFAHAVETSRSGRHPAAP